MDVNDVDDVTCAAAAVYQILRMIIVTYATPIVIAHEVSLIVAFIGIYCVSIYPCHSVA